MNKQKYIQSTDGTWYYRSTVAHWLDTRDTAVGEPTVASLPAVINPLRFLLDTILCDNVAIAVIDGNCVIEKDLMAQAGLLSYVVPPESDVIITYNVDITTTTNILGTATESTRFIDVLQTQDILELQSAKEQSRILYLDEVCRDTNV